MNAITPITPVTEGVTLRFSSPSRDQIARQSVYWDIHRHIRGLGKVKVGPIEGGNGNWYMDVASETENQFLDPSRMNNILVSGVTVTKLSTNTLPWPVVASGDEPETSLKEDIQKLVEKRLKMTEDGWKPEYHGRITQKGGRAIYNTGPHASREEAISSCFKAYPNAKECSVGFGKGGAYSDIRWHRNENYNVNKPQSFGKTV